MKRLYLILAVIGAILPYFYFARFFASDGMNLSAFLTAAMANPVASGFTADLVLSSVGFWILMMIERKRNPEGAPHPALFIALNLLIGLSCALPAWLYTREPGNS